MVKKIFNYSIQILLTLSIVSCGLGGSSGSSSPNITEEPKIKSMQLNFAVEGDFPTGSEILVSVLKVNNIENPTTMTVSQQFRIIYDNQQRLSVYSVNTNEFEQGKYLVEAQLKDGSGLSLAMCSYQELSSELRTIKNNIPNIVAPLSNTNIIKGQICSPVRVKVDDIETGQSNDITGLSFNALNADIEFLYQPTGSNLSNSEITVTFEYANDYYGDYYISFNPSAVGIYHIGITISDGFNPQVAKAVTFEAVEASSVNQLDFVADKNYPDGHEIVVSIVNEADFTSREQYTVSYIDQQLAYSVICTGQNTVDTFVVAVLNDVNGNSLAMSLTTYDTLDQRTIENKAPVITANIVPENVLTGSVIDQIPFEITDYEEGFVDVSLSANFPEFLTANDVVFKSIPTGSALTNSSLISVSDYDGVYNFVFTPDVAGTYIVEISSNDGLNITKKDVVIVAAGADEGVIDVIIN